MKDTRFSRRAALQVAAALPMAQIVRAQAKPRNIVISSANSYNGGVNCCAKAMEMIRAGSDTLDAIVAGVNIVELDPRDTSVGYGGLPNEDGVVELDCSCMHGPTRRGGAVGAIRGIKTPSKIAQLVLLETDHMMLVGEGALRFAKAYGFPEEDLLTEKSRLAWRMWKREMRDRNGHTNWESGTDGPPKPKKIGELKKAFPQYDEETIAWAYEVALNPPHGTINCISLNEKGEMSAITTTSGLAWKIPGRVGDSPIIGGGLWLDQDIGGAGSTGRGEENLRVAGAHTIVENMRHGMAPKEAALDALKRVARNFDNDEERLKAVDLNFYVLRQDGEYAGASLWGGRGRNPQFAVCTEDKGSRQEPCLHLLEWKA
ncbi:MAG TPA: N(4)-(beta-N-acetylglucosaminyl)-L-asparaginase [Bryobacteraceae bacterium]|nr:N(4)-(beta-N-acetylglucosaminyl)-L-asparaginase [Bryobacteraceae bacterium]